MEYPLLSSTVCMNDVRMDISFGYNLNFNVLIKSPEYLQQYLSVVFRYAIYLIRKKIPVLFLLRSHQIFHYQIPDFR
jgi:hypothetical protein